MTRSYSAQRRHLVQRYRDAGEKWPVELKDVAAWIIKQGLWESQRSPIEQLTSELSKAMREEYIVDEQGRSVRAKHAVRVEQGVFWDDIRTATPAHMRMAFQQRRQQIVGDSRQLKTDVDSFNENHNVARPIQLSLDFTQDIAELEAAASAHCDPPIEE